MSSVILTPFVTEVNAEPRPEEYKPVIEYFDSRHNLIIRAHVIGHIISNDEVYLIVQPLGYHACGQWVGVDTDDTAFKICTTKLMIGQVS